RAMISVPQGAGAITIESSGAVSAQLAEDGSSQQIGQIDLVMVRSPENLIDTGNGYFEADDNNQLTTVKPGEDGGGVVVQGTLEASNSQLVDEMTTLLLTQRAFGANAQVVQAGDQLMA